MVGPKEKGTSPRRLEGSTPSGSIMTDEELQDLRDRLAHYREYECSSLLGHCFMFAPGSGESMT